MRCADPKICYTKSSGKAIWRNFSYVQKNTLFLRDAKYVFDCGKCVFCRKKRGHDLAVRCVLHASLYKENAFITLTYDEKKNGYHNNYDIRDVQLFKKKLRRQLKKKIEIFHVHEYGKNKKKHWHLVVFNHDWNDKEIYSIKNGLPLYTSVSLANTWGHGFCTLADVSEASAHYQAQYMEKDFVNGHTSKYFHKSFHRGIGLGYFRKHFEQILNLGYIPFGGRKLPISRTFLKEADRHYSYFYDQRSFEPRTGCTYAKHRPPNLPNLAIAKAFIKYQSIKEEVIEKLEKKWNEYLERDWKLGFPVPEFRQSADNYVHDQNQKTKKEFF